MPEWLPLVGLLDRVRALVSGIVGWIRHKRESQRADLRLYWNLDGDTCLLFIRNASTTATATNVQLYVDAKPFANHERVLRNAENLASLPPFPPGHIEVKKLGVRVNAKIGTNSTVRPAVLKRVHATWHDGRGKHQLTPRDVETLPRFQSNGDTQR